ncbi:MAG: trimethylamine methyltransferase family protein [Saccharofermentanales bacterium]
MRQSPPVIDFMTESQRRLIHDNSMRILAEIGMYVPSEEVLHLCEAKGAAVDYDRQHIHIPRKVMEDLLDRIRKESHYDVQDDKIRKLSAGISTQVYLFDYKTQSRRPGRTSDIRKGIRLLEKLDNFPGSGAVVLPSDVPANVADVEAFHSIFAYAGKQGGTFILTPESAKYIVEMTNVMGRGSGYFLETVSPLQFRRESLEMALVMTKMGCGVAVGPMVLGGALGPITIAGNCSLQNAELIGSMFVGHALTGQYGFGYGSYNHVMDMRSMICSFGSPSQALLGVAAAEMSKFYGFWAASNSGLTDSFLPDYQCGIEKATTAIFSLLAGTRSTGAMGIVGADQGISLEQLVLDNEFISSYNYIMEGFEVSEETLAFDLIRQVGIGGNYLSEEHTVEHMADSYFPSSIFLRNNYDTWLGSGKKSAFDLAHEFVEETTAGYMDMDPVVTPSVFDELTRIRNEAFSELTRT